MMKRSDSLDKSRGFSLKMLAFIVALAIVLSVLATLLVARTWLFPSPIKQVNLDQHQEAVLEAKLDTLKRSGNGRAMAEPSVQVPEKYAEHPVDRVIYFTQRELNAMIARDPNLADRLSFHLSDNLISANMLVDMPPDFPLLGGKTVRISTGLNLDYQQGRPVVKLEGISIMGVPVPGAWLGGIKGLDLVQAYGEDGGFWRAFSHGVRDLRVENGQLRVELAE
jgi:hypothetical protein